ncbi:MAG: aminoacyl-tRNA hydrolase [Clostridia bacterium]|nr:aminoacyl-tRNA hydrolase [Clostridia bacterium]
MKIIVGLGNPGKEYENTRHNLGYKVADLLSEKLKIKINKEKMEGQYGNGKVGDEKVILLKPLTYMNLSGNCVSKFLNYYKVSPEDLIVIYDDIDIKVGKIRIKPNGNPGTHNGMKDITNKIGTKDFIRVRVGSGKPEFEMDLADYVLSNFKKEEMDDINKSIENASDAVVKLLKDGIAEAMNKYN